MELDESLSEMSMVGGTQTKRRGRPCALERYNNELLQEKFSRLINHSHIDFNSDFARLNILPFINKRQRRARANDRERTRMQTLNGALNVLKQHLPIDFLLSTDENSMLHSPTGSSSGRKSNKEAAESASNKLTKIDTLKLATRYIAMLTNLLNEPHSNSSSHVKLNTTDNVIAKESSVSNQSSSLDSPSSYSCEEVQSDHVHQPHNQFTSTSASSSIHYNDYNYFSSNYTLPATNVSNQTCFTNVDDNQFRFYSNQDKCFFNQNSDQFRYTLNSF